VTLISGTGDVSAAGVIVTETTKGVASTADQFTLTFDGQTTAALTYITVTAADIETALEALSNIDNVTVTGSTDTGAGTGTFTVTFVGALVSGDVAEMTGTPTNNGTVTITTPTQGLGCHDPHGSAYPGLTLDNQESLCFTCHTQASPNTSGGGTLWNAAPSALADPSTTAGSDVWTAFNGTPNSYTDPIRIYHHPVAEAEQEGGTRTIECASCHNVHLADYLPDAPGKSKVVDPANVQQPWDFGWDFTSSYLTRGTNVVSFCMKCHTDPAQTQPLTAGPTVPYTINMVIDAYEEFQITGSNHTPPDAAVNSYEGCKVRGLAEADCTLACTNCHDSHGSSNAMLLRDVLVPPDWQAFTITSATWSGGTATLEYTTSSGLVCTAADMSGCAIDLGYTVTVQGVGLAGYNGTFVTTNAATNHGPIEYSLPADPGGPSSGGTVAPPSSYTLTGWDGNFDTLPRDFCFTCHTERGKDHKSGSACTSCHRHDSGRKL
jgi:predicted CXXCH cytochrome family protein